MDDEMLKDQLLSSLDEIVKIISKDNTAEVKNSKDGVVVYEISKKKRK